MEVKKLLLRAVRRIVLWQSDLNQGFYIPYWFKKIFKGYAIENINGFKMHLDLKNDEGISKALLFFKKWEHLPTEFLQNQKFINKGETALDIGANIGYYALLESGLVGPEGKVYAIEPVSSNFSILNKNIELNGIKNIKTFKMAMGREKQDIEINISSQGNRSSFITRGGTVYTKKEKVEMTTVDDFVSEQQIAPNFIRMDVEGYEREIFKGMRKILLSTPKLFIEFHPREIGFEEFHGMLSMMLESGYSKVVIFEKKFLAWMNQSGEVRPILYYLARKIEGLEKVRGIGKVEHLTLQALYERRHFVKDSFCAFIS